MDVGEDFAVAQVYLPYRRLLNVLAMKNQDVSIKNLFLVQHNKDDGRMAIRVYEYTFEDPLDMGFLFPQTPISGVCCSPILIGGRDDEVSLL